MSVTTGTRGFHNTYNFGTGRRTTSVGIPETGLSYITTSSENRTVHGTRTNGITQCQPQNSNYEYPANDPISQRTDTDSPVESQEGVVPDDAFLVKQPLKPAEIISTNQLTLIHFKAAPTIDWTEVLIQDTPLWVVKTKLFGSIVMKKLMKSSMGILILISKSFKMSARLMIYWIMDLVLSVERTIPT